MALIECTECGKQISDQANNCPGCGVPVNKNPLSPARPGAGLETGGFFLLLVGLPVAIWGVYDEAQVALALGAISCIFGITFFIAGRLK